VLAAAAILALGARIGTAAVSLPAIDGRIADGEYASHYRAPGIGMELHWTIEDDSICVGLKAPTQGWLAIGWDPIGPIKAGPTS
jgi:hypothetical protein